MPMPKGEEATKKIHLCTPGGRTKEASDDVTVKKGSDLLTEKDAELDVNDLVKHTVRAEE